MFKEWLKQFLAVCICAITILSTFSPAFADDYVESDSGDDATYYIIEGKDVDSLFDFSIWNIPDIVSWMFQFKTYTVIKKYEDKDGDTQYKCYFNTPNLQSIVKNSVISLVSDGYTDDTYKIEDTEWVVKVGQNASSENVITKYGFAVPSYTYMGEFPKEVMSTAGILPSPKNWLEVAWTAIKSLFGVSFIKAPDADNFNTISYLNHAYTNNSDYILEFFKEYYLDYFERQIPIDWVDADASDLEGDYFSGPEEVISMAVTESAYDAARNYNNAHSDEFSEAVTRYTYYNEYNSGGVDACLELTPVSNKQYDSWHFMASIEKYKDQFNSWVNANPAQAYLLIDAALCSYNLYDNNGSTLNSPDDYGLTTSSYSENAELETSVSLAADILRYTADSDNFKARISYNTVVTTTAHTVTSGYQSHYIGSDGTETVSSLPYMGGDTPGTPAITTTYNNDDVAFKDTAAWRDTDSSYYDNYSNTAGASSAATAKDDKSGDDDTYWYTWNESTYTTTETKNNNYNIVYLYSHNDTSNTMTYDAYKTFVSTCSFSALTYDESDFVPVQLQGIFDTYNESKQLQADYEAFNAMLARGDDQDDDTSKKELLYRQCMITNEGEDNECWSKKYGDDKTSLTAIQVYAYSRIYTVTENYSSSTHKLTDSDAHEILTMLQAYCGPYSTEVIANMIKIMCATAKYEGEDDPTKLVISDDKRVMPYDTASLLANDRENYGVTDPRVELYKTHVVGKLISKFELSPLSIGIYLKPQKTIVSIVGKVTELSVFMQQLCDFDVLDDYGLSPANMWTSGYVTLLMCLLAVFFIFKTVFAIIKIGTNSGSRVVIAFFILVFELGLITATFANPQRVWDMVKNVENKVINLGEMATVYSIPEIEYLYGSASDMEVTYYMPYLDTWSKYNTGYGILEDEQLMDDTADYRELVDKEFPTIDGTEVKHWSVLLMDSFHYWGYSNAVTNTITINGNTYNGNVINNNAYRVVDHFMAPRVDLGDEGDYIEMEITQNENYNGEFQSGMVDIMVKLMNCFLLCLLSLIKLMTFLWQWFVFYIFIFRVLLGRGSEGKPMGRIVLETFAPTICMILIGLYSGMVMIMGMNAEGLIGIFLEIFLFWLTFMIVRWWHDAGRQTFFPNTLIWLYYITNLSRAQRRIQQDKIKNQAKNQDIENGMEEGYSDADIDKQREMLFDENGNLRERYKDKKYNTQVMNWHNRAKALEGHGYNKQHTEETRRQMRNLEASDRFSEKIKNAAGQDTSSALSKTDKIGHGITKDSDEIDTHADVTNHTSKRHLSLAPDKNVLGRGKSSGTENDGDVSEATDNSQKVADMYNESNNEPGNKQSTDADDYGHTKTRSGQEKKKGPKQIGRHDED